MEEEVVIRNAVARVCTLPIDQWPLRRAEFDDLFTTALRRQRRTAPTRLQWELDPSARRRAEDLTAREAGCCQFFVFTFTSAHGRLWLDVEVPPEHVSVLDALAGRAQAAVGTSA